MQFQGPSLTGVAPHATPPTRWGESENVRWKTPIHGRGWSSPLVIGDKLWLTTATEAGDRLSLLAVDRASGKIVFDEVVFTNDSVQPDYHHTNSYASPTPVSDGETLVVHFGAYGTAAFDQLASAKPRQRWQRRDLPCNHFRGPGSSPILHDGRVLLHFDGYDQRYATSLSLSDGATQWRRDRVIEYGTNDGDMMKAFATPTVIYAAGRDQWISATAKAVLSLDPATGEEWWRVRYDEHSTSTKPLFDGERLYVGTGWGKAKLLAIRPDGNGDVTETHVDWTSGRAIGSKPNPVVHGNWIFTVDDRGVVGCLDKSDGSTLWQKRVGGEFSATPIVADGRFYAFDESGQGYVFAADDHGTLIAQNQLGSGCMALPAAVGDRLYVRTKTNLYCLSGV